ncbi:MAG: polyphosphate kinase 2 family protein [Candidatus Omnitrophica bacterium]|nr:polyphosphate kinase 2 family protein [Candidatus Omnitrophota bacterium]
MKINVKDFQVIEGRNIDLKKRPTLIKPFYKSKDHYKEMLEQHIAELSGIQNVLYADNRYALLLIFQAMDAAGKDGAIKHVMSGVNPQGCQVFSFKHPSPEELDHDFLWRTTRDLPQRGMIGIFNRSYYEEVLVVRVHPQILQGEKIPNPLLSLKTIWEERFRSIRDLEKHLYYNGTRIIKFFLHLSKEEQRRRFLKRLDDPSKNWKISLADMQERKFWKDYMKAYEACLSATSLALAPWFIVPADDKENARLIISQTIMDTLKSLKMSYPQPDSLHRKELLAMRKELLRTK